MGNVGALTRVFQFHKGAIKTGDGAAAKAGAVNFNSIKVRLKPSTSSFLGRGRLFQFHKGAIKTKIKGIKGQSDAEISIP